MTIDYNGIPKTVDNRLASAGRLVGILDKNSVSLEKLYIEPQVLSIAVSSNNTVTFYQGLTEIKEQYGAKTMSGLCNVSHSLHQRRLINRYFWANSMNLGVDAAILDPLGGRL
ncbi:MAG: hypothetical protein PHX16_08315 [Syntrophaceticus sp.]|nr:hypothetical protein [Syntrophaceticus sp.]MDD3315671.1 hypothetical protein [Syntrophaceticus sp.]MDD4360737.1 hypothetical protein [Syntrophaceticus sp.]MDD4783612.1 hypothetical protein [Syntrophaceticus sp.]